MQCLFTQLTLSYPAKELMLTYPLDEHHIQIEKKQSFEYEN